MSGQALTFANYSPARFAKLEALLATKGFHLDSNQGQVKEFGAHVFYVYDAEAQTLLLTVESAPHFHSMDGFCAELSKAVTGVAA